MKSAAAIGLGIALFALCISASAVKRSPADTAAVTIGEQRTAGEMTVPVNKSQMLRVNRAFGEITVGSKDIVDVVPISKTEAYVMGKKPGSTSLAILDRRGKAIAVVDVIVSGDTE